MKRCLIVLALLAGPAQAAVSYVRAGRLLDVATGRVATDRLIRIDGERIVAVIAWSGAPADGPVTDWSRYTVLPGLIDMHTHLSDWGQTSNVAEPLLHSAVEIAFVGAANARATLRAGFTSVHDVGCYRGLATSRCVTRSTRGASRGHG